MATFKIWITGNLPLDSCLVLAAPGSLKLMLTGDVNWIAGRGSGQIGVGKIKRLHAARNKAKAKLEGFSWHDPVFKKKPNSRRIVQGLASNEFN